MQNLALDIRDRARGRGARVAMRHKSDGRWLEITYAELDATVERIAAGLVRLGVTPGDRVALYAPNMPAWTLCDLAVLSVGAVTVPVYATSTAEQLAAIVEDSGARVLVAGTPQEAVTAAGVAAGRTLILCEGEAPAQAPGAIALATLAAAAIEPGTAAELRRREAAASDDDLASIIYTSGTTGDPKGVLLTHANFRCQFASLDRRFELGPDDHSLCFLPLSHVYERAWSYYVYFKGARNSFVADPKQVVAYLAEVRPTAMVSAPRLYEKVHTAVHEKIARAPRLRRTLFHWAVRTGGAYQAADRGRRAGPGLKLRHAVADRLVLRKIRDLMGGPKSVLSAGGAPLSSDIENFFLAAGLLICQGYGLTETAPMITCNAPGAWRFGTVGKPIDGVEVRIADDGEILVRGPNVTAGYHNRPAETAAALRDGWLHTGDIGHLDADGYLVVTDRIKDLIVTSTGKKVAPQRIEMLVGGDHFIDQLAVVGDRRQYVSALVVPAFEALKAWALEKRIAFRDHEDLIGKPEVVQLMEERIRSRSQQLAPFETIRKFTLLARQFTQQTGEITPTLKVRRKVIAEKYRHLIDRMYN
ncbi:MAG: long-chain fatty acid--CoA ligase [Candidatus Latescibacteria bacterium]|nr:long-chain fatty acid--CoA ligase [Candidatus Latescibacterota bacterium]